MNKVKNSQNYLREMKLGTRKESETWTLTRIQELIQWKTTSNGWDCLITYQRRYQIRSHLFIRLYSLRIKNVKKEIKKSMTMSNMIQRRLQISWKSKSNRKRRNNRKPKINNTNTKKYMVSSSIQISRNGKLIIV